MPKHHLTAPVFDRALVFTRTTERTQQMARAYLVDHYLPGVVARKFSTTKQNVYRAANQLLEDARNAQELLNGIARHWNHLNIPKDIGAQALPFLMQEVTLEDAARQADCAPEQVKDACKAVVTLYRATADSDFGKKEATFQKIMKYSRARDRAFQVAYDGFVLGLSVTDLAERHGITRQNAYNIMRRFHQTKERANDYE